MVKQSSNFKPKNMRSLLIVFLIAILAGGGAVFYLGLQKVGDYATEVGHRLIDADASSQQIEELQNLKTQLAQNNNLLEKAESILADPNDYQPQILNDIKRYADSSGLSIASTKFSNSPEDDGRTVILTLQQPVKYSSLIHFLEGIEGNLPKLQITSIDLGHIKGGGADSVSTKDIKINVAVR